MRIHALTLLLLSTSCTTEPGPAGTAPAPLSQSASTDAADGGRLFDHNRNPDPFQNYQLVADNEWSIADAPAVCAARNAAPVELASAQVPTRVSYPAIQTTVLHGVVRAPTTAEADVTIHYQIREGNDEVVRDWATVDATVAGTGRWEFSTPSYESACPHYCPNHVYQFAVELRLGDETHWDNGAGYGGDYVLANDIGGSVPVRYGPPALLDTPVQLSHTEWSGEYDQLRGQLVLADLAYEKDVSMVYSTDGWQTVREADARFDRLTYDELEYWAFRIHIDDHGDEVQLAIRYRVDGQTHWDNNLGRDYVVETGDEDVTVPPM